LFEPIRLPMSAWTQNSSGTRDVVWSNREWFEGGPSMFEFLTSCRVIGFFSVALLVGSFFVAWATCKWSCRGRKGFVVRADPDSDDDESETSALVDPKEKAYSDNADDADDADDTVVIGSEDEGDDV
jgi:hypothetical protein